MGLIDHSSAARPLALGDWAVHLSGPQWAVEPLARLLAALTIHGDDPGPLDLSISADGQTAQGMRDDRVLWSVTLPAKGWLGLLLGQVVASCTALLNRLLFVHAGAVAIQGRGWILVGESGAGKTSTVARLVRQGAVYLSDEIAVLDPANGTVAPFAIPMAIKPWTAKAAGRLPRGSDVIREGVTRFRLPVDRAAGPVPVQGFVLLDHGQPPARLRPISRAQFLVAMAHHHSSLRHPHRLSDAFAGFGRLLRLAHCYQLASPHPAAGADEVQAAARTGAAVIG